MQWALAGGRPADSNASSASVKKSEPPKFPDLHGPKPRAATPATGLPISWLENKGYVVGMAIGMKFLSCLILTALVPGYAGHYLTLLISVNSLSLSF